MTKSQALERWQGLEPNQPIMPHFVEIPYKATGSKYGTCGIRIDGTPQFIDAVLSHLKEILQGENDNTRLNLSRNTVENRLEGHDFHNAEINAECCYIRLCERGDQSKICNAIIRAHSRRRPSAARDDDYLL